MPKNRRNASDFVASEEGKLAVASATGWKLGKCLGEGFEGVVYQSTAGRVVKICDSDGDFCVAQAILKTAKPPIWLPRVYGAEHIQEDIYGDKELWAVLREDLRDLPKTESVGVDWDAIRYAITEAKSLALRGFGMRAYVRALEAPNFGDEALLYETKTKAVYQHIKKTLLWLAEFEISVGDVRKENLGYRPSSKLVVIRDFSIAHVHEEDE